MNLPILVFVGIFMAPSMMAEENGKALVINRNTVSDDKLPRGAISSEVWKNLGGGLFRAQFHIYPTFLSGGVNPESFASHGYNFGDEETSSHIKKNAQDILSDAGIAFADGTSAVYNQAAGILVVVQTADQIPLIESYMDSIQPYVEKLMAIRIEVFEVSVSQGMQVLDSTQSEGQHNPERAALIKAVHDGSVVLLAAPSLTCRSGNRASIQETITSGDSKPLEDSGNNVGEPYQEPKAAESRVPLTEFEVDAVLGADEITMDLNYSITLSELSDSSSADAPSFYRQRKLTTQTTLRDGNSYLVGNWSSGGGLMRLVFLSGHIQTLDSGN